jgi:hypothetical protein
MAGAFRATALIAVAAVVGLGLAGCSVKPSAAKELQAAVSATEKAISTRGVLASFTEFDASVAREVHDPKFGLYVNDATEIGSANSFKQISRNNLSSASAIDSVLNFVGAKVGAQVWFAGTNYEINSKSLVRTPDGTIEEKLTLKNMDDKKSIVSGSLRFTIKAGLISRVLVSPAFYNKANPEEVCQYSPESCTRDLRLDYSSAEISKAMAHAFAGYEFSQIHGGDNVQNFEALMRAMQQTVDTLKSWTTLNQDASVGSVYDAEAKHGASWNPYDGGDKLTATNVNAGWSGPDNNAVSQTFFDTTDGGSSFFYQSIEVDHATGTYSVKDSSGAIAATFTFADGILSGFSDTFNQFTVSPKAEPQVLANH